MPIIKFRVKRMAGGVIQGGNRGEVDSSRIHPFKEERKREKGLSPRDKLHSLIGEKKGRGH